MKLNNAAASMAAIMVVGNAFVAEAQRGQMVKMCLFYENPSGHARSDPIINQQCASDHVHTVSQAITMTVFAILIIRTSCVLRLMLLKHCSKTYTILFPLAPVLRAYGFSPRHDLRGPPQHSSRAQLESDYRESIPLLGKSILRKILIF